MGAWTEAYYEAKDREFDRIPSQQKGTKMNKCELCGEPMPEGEERIMTDKEFELQHDLGQARERMADYTRTIGEQISEIARLKEQCEAYKTIALEFFKALAKMDPEGAKAWADSLSQ